MNRGFSLIEILIAMAIATLTMAGVVIFLGGDQSMGSDSGIGIEALHKAQDVIEKASAQARTDYAGVATTTVSDCSGGLCYAKSLALPSAYATQCTQAAVGTVSWTGTQNRVLSVAATTTIVNIPEMIALGGTCGMSPPTAGWNPPTTYTCARFNSGNPTALDVLDKVAYMTGEAAPYLYIADTNGALLNSSCNNANNVQFTVFTNGFNAGVELTDIRVARASDGKVYAFVAADSSTNQLRVYDVTTPTTPVLIVARTLASVSGSFPEGFRIYYYDKKIYILTRETAGNEFHVFDAATPWNAASIVEYGTGFAINRTVESFAVTKRAYSGSDHLYAYMATDGNSNELVVLDVTNPLAISEITYVDQNLAGNDDGLSVFLLGNTLYLGRESASGSELYAYDASTPWDGLNMLGQSEIGTSVIGIAVSGPFAFLATTQASNEFKVWQSNPFNLATINSNFNFPNSLVPNAVRYSDNWIYMAVQGNDSLRILKGN